MQTQNNILPEIGLVRLSQILGNKKKGIPPVIPVSKSTWWAGVKSGRYPQPIKLGERTTCWNVADIRQLICQPEVSS
ncbi:MAG: AlpA family phage regulatory protein [Oryzomonas sp.]|uniref:helix-turn-helix transcriptional regulator n=1 Tax=Oryzomonas sp. TaxID=2855186 RepID=UPI00284D5FB5|nr:AlpA family phage regulatory protein [Oryzomonas sp.]MDR3581315.1 AlpA family phage regulatory protein [Oryzomonas sp.]